MTTINEFTPGMIYKFNEEEYVFAVILAIGCLLGIVGLTIIIYATLQQRQYTVATKMILSLCFSELGLLINVGVHGMCLL